ncbi:substrate-binding periplasmic protein [Chitinilyticum litopenaei]|uniref:substrate-binding periplasmic protein n=1 Tax=Chitinilyticum litopenaei TaxID=1121276 RepID=UPI000424FA86|nr:transporter substrate-binding domain-containing protein [Chitinilyticum litopenaei]
MKIAPARPALLLTALRLGALLAPLLAQAAPFPCPAQPIRLAFYEYGLLYHQGRGIDRDLVDELARRTGCRFDTRVMPRARIWADLESGALDMSVSGIQTPARDRFAWFAHYLSMKNHALVSSALAGEVRQASDFLATPRALFGVVRAFKHGEQQDRWLDTLRQAQRVQESPDAQTLYLKLKQGRVQAIFSQPPVYRHYLPTLDMQQQVSVQDWTPQEKGVPHGLILAKSRFSQTEAQHWQEQLHQMRADGSLRAIYLRYLPPADTDALLDF